ncbi:hypothetical protein BDSB_02265 [Burkholderia dolosa PC543]|jgi:hypothetical protein|nr:hypothetical protein BDSB_02265 [Burkholderia dolosa PC543]
MLGEKGARPATRNGAGILGRIFGGEGRGNAVSRNARRRAFRPAAMRVAYARRRRAL